MLPNNKLNSKTNLRLQQNIAAELVHLLYSQATGAIKGTILIATCFTYVIHRVEPPYVLNNETTSVE